MTGLEALKNLADRFAIKKYDEEGDLIYWEGTIDREYAIIENEFIRLYKIEEAVRNISSVWANATIKLKAFEIIKEKEVDAYMLMDLETLEEYNEWVLKRYGAYYQLTQEEFKLLKETMLE